VRINNGASITYDPNVTLNLWASDEIDPELEGFGPQFLPPGDSASGVTSMQIRNDPNFNYNDWEPYITSKPWRLGLANGLASVYVRYQDATGNQSKTYVATIWIVRDPSVKEFYLPVINKH